MYHLSLREEGKWTENFLENNIVFLNDTLMGASNEEAYKEGLCGTYERDEISMQNCNLQTRTKD
jgi:hypothetical protein